MIRHKLHTCSNKDLGSSIHDIKDIRQVLPIVSRQTSLQDFDPTKPLLSSLLGTPTVAHRLSSLLGVSTWPVPTNDDLDPYTDSGVIDIATLPKENSSNDI